MEYSLLPRMNSRLLLSRRAVTTVIAATSLGLLSSLYAEQKALPTSAKEATQPKKLADTTAAKKATPPEKPTAYDPVEDVAGLPRVLLIGDSISVGYTMAVRAELKGKANVHRPAANCGPTRRGLEKIEMWLDTGGKGKKWDIIHFNWGLHDLRLQATDGKSAENSDKSAPDQVVSIEEYRKNLETLVERLQKTGAKLIWCSTTPVPDGASGRRTEDVPKYNAVAAEVMKKAGIAVDDLYEYALPKLADIQLPANVHYTPEGSKVLAKAVAQSIEAVLPQK